MVLGCAHVRSASAIQTQSRRLDLNVSMPLRHFEIHVVADMTVSQSVDYIYSSHLRT